MTRLPTFADPRRAPGPIRGARFIDSYARFWRFGFTFSGRASRSEYWFSVLANNIIVVVLSALIPVTLGIPLLLYSPAALLPSLAVAVRRLHDNNRSGAMMLLQLVPFGGIFVLVFLLSDSDPAGIRYDRTALPVLTPPATHAVAPQSAPQALPSPPPPSPAAAPATLPPTTVLAPSVSVAAPPLPSSVATQTALPPIVMPTVAPVASAITMPPAAHDASDELDSTRMSVPLANAEWIIELSDGRSVPLVSAVVFGRAPSNDGEAFGAVLVPIVDPSKSMSKTHARIGLDGALPSVTDLHSTNGTKITVEGVTTLLTPGVALPFALDAEVMLGSYSVRVRRTR